MPERFVTGALCCGVLPGDPRRCPALPCPNLPLPCPSTCPCLYLPPHPPQKVFEYGAIMALLNLAVWGGLGSAWWGCLGLM